MGAGKTTVGRQLSRATRKEFVDADRELEQRTGASIPLIFELEGEDGFRDREENLLKDLSQGSNLVLATGGGVVLRENNRSVLRSNGFVIYLVSSIDLLVERTSRDRSRPLLYTDDPKAKFESLMEIRDPLYRDVADLVMKTDNRSIKYVVKDILKRVSQL